MVFEQAHGAVSGCAGLVATVFEQQFTNPNFFQQKVQYHKVLSMGPNENRLQTMLNG
jgi:hypothetical protein